MSIITARRSTPINNAEVLDEDHFLLVLHLTRPSHLQALMFPTCSTIITEGLFHHRSAGNHAAATFPFRLMKVIHTQACFKQEKKQMLKKILHPTRIQRPRRRVQVGDAVLGGARF